VHLTAVPAPVLQGQAIDPDMVGDIAADRPGPCPGTGVRREVSDSDLSR
jgi:hypothetical protein